jgi:hypothetical protein
MALRPATDDDWIALYGSEPPGNWFGLVSARSWLIEGMGAVYCDVNGRWWATFSRTPGVVKIKTAHEGARKLLAAARERNIVLHAIAKPGVDKAELWLARLGFAPSDETVGGLTVWTR